MIKGLRYRQAQSPIGHVAIDIAHNTSSGHVLLMFATWQNPASLPSDRRVILQDCSDVAEARRRANVYRRQPAGAGVAYLNFKFDADNKDSVVAALANIYGSNVIGRIDILAECATKYSRVLAMNDEKRIAHRLEMYRNDPLSGSF